MELLDLIDDVLLNVCERLDVFELCALARTCHRLAALAASVASRRYRCLDYERFMHAHNDFRVPRCRSDFAATMRFIGPHVQRMHFDGNRLKKQKSRGQPVVPDETYEQHYEHTAALTVELRNFARFDQLWPQVANYFHRLRLVHLSFEDSAAVADAWRTQPLSWPVPDEDDEDDAAASADGAGAAIVLGDEDALNVLTSYGFHVDDTRLGYIFQYWPVDELYVRSPDLEKAALGGGGAGGALEWSGFRGRALCELGGVRRCELRFCHRVQVQHFQQFAVNNADSLRHLVLAECAQLNGSETVFRDVALHMAELRQLRAMFRDVCPPLGRLTELRELRVLELEMASDCERLVEDLAINDRLEELHLTDCLVDFSADGMFESGEFFTRLREVSLLGNVLDSRALARFAGDRLEVIRFAYGDAEMADGVVRLVSESPALRLVEMYCTEWLSVETLQRMAEARSAALTATTGRLLLQLSLELFDEADRSDLEELVRQLEAVAIHYIPVMEIVIV